MDGTFRISPLSVKVIEEFCIILYHEEEEVCVHALS